MIKLLLSLLVILVGGLSAPTPHRPAHTTVHGQPGPLILPRPSHPRAGRPFELLVVGLPHGARDVRLIASGGSWPARPAAGHAFLGHPVPPAAGPWQINVRFREHGHVHRGLAGVVVVRPG